MNNERMREHHTPATAPATDGATRRAGTESIPELLRDLINDLQSLVSKEASLAKAEFRETASDIQTAIMSITLGASLAIGGLVVLLMSAVYGLNNVVEPWLSALIVGAVALLIGYMMISAARKKVKHTSAIPERTVESVKRDANTVKRAAR
jgi:hypothetical protein